jgi:stage II sporulation protein D
LALPIGGAFQLSASLTVNAVMKILFSLLAFLLCTFGAFAADIPLDTAAALKESREYTAAINKLSVTGQNVLSVEEKHFLARLYFLNGDDLKALEIFSHLEPLTWQDLVYKGLCCEAIDKNDMAVEAYSSSLKLQENSIALYRLGKIYFHRNDFTAAAQFFTRTIALDKSIRLAYYYLGKCSLNEGNFVKAHTYLAQASNFYPQKNEPKKEEYLAHDKLGDNYFEDKKKEKENIRKNIRLAAYARDTTAPLLKVGIAKNVKEVTFKCGEAFLITDGKNSFRAKPDHFYVMAFREGRLALRDYLRRKVLVAFNGPVDIKAKKYPFYVFDITLGAGNFWHRQLDGLFRGDLRLLPSSDTVTLVNIVSVEDYLCGVLPSEILPGSPAQALAAQAVAARTIALKSFGRHKKEGYDVCSEVHCQAYGGMLVERPATTLAVKDTRGTVLLYKNNLAEAFYHANCGGCLRDDAFGVRNESLLFKRDSDNPVFSPTAYDLDRWFIDAPQDTFSYTTRSGYRWQRIFDQEDFLFLFKQDIGSLKNINFSGRGPCGHYSLVAFDDATTSILLKNDLDIRNYFDGLRSSAFDFEVKYSADKKPQFLIFWGAGFGHGAGLSQDGAVKMGKLRRSYTDILKHYYPNAQIEKRY